MNQHWILARPQPEMAATLATQLRISPLLAQCLLNRGLCENIRIQSFLHPQLKSLSDPFLLPNMEAAVDRLYAARGRGERVVIYGDYDVDGVTSTALLVKVLRAMGWQTDYYVPNRLEEGYGLSREGAEKCVKRFSSTLLLAVDCGSTAVETIGWLQRSGVDVLVLDHHQVSSPPPPALALVNPRIVCNFPTPSSQGQPGENTPMSSNLKQESGVAHGKEDKNGPRFLELCSAGLAFKLAHALVKRGRQEGLAEARDYDVRLLLDLVALGTIADLVPLTGENRSLVAAGLERLNMTQSQGLQALKAVAQLGNPVQVHSVAFQLAPRLNAAGRLEDAELSLRLLLTDNPAEAEELAQNLDARNRERQTIEKTITEQVIKIVRAKFDPQKDYVIVEGLMPWHIGVVGIVASRILRQFHRPTIIVGGDDGAWRGSGRSIEGFDLAAALQSCDDLLVRHGGHALAAGLAVAPSKVDALRERLNELARLALTQEQLRPSIRLDASVSLADITLERLAELDEVEPVGQGNPPAQFAALRVRCERPPRSMGKDHQHLKLWITDGTTTHEAIGWGLAKIPLPAEPFDLAFVPKMNEFNGRRGVQLNILGWRPSSPES